MTTTALVKSCSPEKAGRGAGTLCFIVVILVMLSMSSCNSFV